MRKIKKTRAITFRVNEEQFAAIERLALIAGSDPTDWSRDAVLEKVDGPEARLSAGERLLFYELTKVRFLLGNGLSLLAAQNLTPAGWDKLRKEASEQVQEIARSLVATYDSHWFFSTSLTNNASDTAADGSDEGYSEH